MFSSLKHSVNSLGLIINFVRKVFPIVNNELDYWHGFASSNGCPELSEQALASIRDKKFHCQGGSIYSLYQGVSTPDFVRLVVALQTISDYLDNLCDRAGIADEQSFRQLHLAMTDALSLDGPLNDYYRFYPFKDDGGYLAQLVAACRQETAKLPSYHLVENEALKLAALYSDLQTYKHLELSVREIKMREWIDQHIKVYPDIGEWEFAAATGSTLGMFMLCAAASDPSLEKDDARVLSEAYFPWISGLHILLDYFIDAAEDRENGDLNFVAYYNNEQHMNERLNFFAKQALQQTKAIPNQAFGKTVVHGLLAMYLSDPKADKPTERAIRNTLLNTGGAYTNIIYGLCRMLRSKGLL